MGEDALHPHLFVLKILLESSPFFRFENTFGRFFVLKILLERGMCFSVFPF